MPWFSDPGRKSLWSFFPSTYGGLGNLVGVGGAGPGTIGDRRARQGYRTPLGASGVGFPAEAGV